MAPVTIDDRAVRKAFKRATRALSNTKLKQLFSMLGSRVKINILKRTASGEDVNDDFFQEYSSRYKLFREEAGRPTNKVDLLFQGEMLGSMSVKASSDKAIVYFADKTQADKARWHHYGTDRLPEREFFAMNASDMIDIEKEINRFIDKEIL
jgi:phage gpG-like protein